MAIYNIAWLVGCVLIQDLSAVNTGCILKRDLCESLRFQDGYKYDFNLCGVNFTTCELEVYHNGIMIAHSDDKGGFTTSVDVIQMSNTSFIIKTCENVTVQHIGHNDHRCIDYIVREEGKKELQEFVGNIERNWKLPVIIVSVVLVALGVLAVLVCRYRRCKTWVHFHSAYMQMFYGGKDESAVDLENVSAPANGRPGPHPEAQTVSETPQGVPLQRSRALGVLRGLFCRQRNMTPPEGVLPLSRLDGGDRLSDGDAPLPNGRADVTRCDRRRADTCASGAEEVQTLGSARLTKRLVLRVPPPSGCVAVDVPDEALAFNGHAGMRASTEDDPGGAIAERDKETDALIIPISTSSPGKETPAPKWEDQRSVLRRPKETPVWAIPEQHANGAPMQSSVRVPSGVQTPGDQSLEEQPNDEETLGLVGGPGHDPDPATEPCLNQDKSPSGVESTGNKCDNLIQNIYNETVRNHDNLNIMN